MKSPLSPRCPYCARRSCDSLNCLFESPYDLPGLQCPAWLRRLGKVIGFLLVAACLMAVILGIFLVLSGYLYTAPDEI